MNVDAPLNTADRSLVPETEGIKYAGSKLKLLPYIHEMISGLDIRNVLDGFSGSTRVSQMFAKLGLITTSNDISDWSETLASAYLLNTRRPEHYQPIIDHLNGMNGYEGWFSQHYGSDGTEHANVKRPFQRKNTMKLDAVRDEIDRMELDPVERSVALTSLILALDSVDSTLGHFASYLADWSPRSHNEMRLKLPMLFVNRHKNRVVKDDIFAATAGAEFDLAYFDPPYGSNNDKMPPSRVRYNSYYHLWTTVVRNDRPQLFGKVNRREDSRDTAAPSVFEEFRKDENGNFIAMNAIRSLIERTAARYILLSYSSGGRATKEALYDILNTGGKLIRAVEIDYRKNVMGTMRWTNEWITSDGKHTEYLFLMEKH